MRTRAHPYFMDLLCTSLMHQKSSVISMHQFRCGILEICGDCLETRTVRNTRRASFKEHRRTARAQKKRHRLQQVVDATVVVDDTRACASRRTLRWAKLRAPWLPSGSMQTRTGKIWYRRASRPDVGRLDATNFFICRSKCYVKEAADFLTLDL
jgi:hypothetical protein